MIMFDEKKPAITRFSAQPCAPGDDLPLLATPGDGKAATEAAITAGQQTAVRSRLQVARENCELALDNIQMAEMVVRFLEHLLEAKARKSLAADELASTRSTIDLARADLQHARLGYRQACKAFHAAHHGVPLAEGKVHGATGAAHRENAELA